MVNGIHYVCRHLRKRDGAPVSDAVVETEERVGRDVYEHDTITGWKHRGARPLAQRAGCGHARGSDPPGTLDGEADAVQPDVLRHGLLHEDADVRGVARRIPGTWTQRMAAPSYLDTAPCECPRQKRIEIPVPASIDQPTFAHAQEQSAREPAGAEPRERTGELPQAWLRVFAHPDPAERAQDSEHRMRNWLGCAFRRTGRPFRQRADHLFRSGSIIRSEVA